MCTSLLLVAFSASMVGHVPETPNWQTDYFAARRLVEEDNKPLAVFIGSGKHGWTNVCQEGELGPEASELLARDYVCVYLDTNRPEGRKLAAAFEMADGDGLVISDHGGRLQAFRHEGELAEKELLRHLKRYADPEYVVRTTETATVERVSYSYESAPSGYFESRYYYYPAFSSGACRT